MANEVLRFDILAVDHASSGFSAAGRAAYAAAGDVSKLQDRLLAVSRTSAAARVRLDGNTEALAALDRTDAKLLGLDRRVASPHLKVEGAARAIADISAVDVAINKLASDTGKAEEGNKGFAASLQKVMDSAKKAASLQSLQKAADSAKGFGPWWLGPAVLAAPAATSLVGVTAGAAIGLGGAAVAGAGALAAFGAVAKPVLADALTAEQKVNTAQNTYNAAIASGTKQATAYKAEQLAINKAYADLSPQQIALSKQLGVMASAWQDLKAAQTPVVAGALQPWLKSVTDLTKNLGPIIAAVSPVIKGLGTQFDTLVNSAAFKGFRDFIANTGSKVVGAVGGTLIDFVKAFMILLPKFNPLIMTMTNGIAGLGPAVLKWASSAKTAGDITKFMDWFHQNGPAVGNLLKNIGGALAALAPGIGPAATSELNVLSGFFGFIAKLPPGLAKPLTEVAGALLLMNKLGVVSVGLKLAGIGGASGAAGAAASTGLWSKLLPGVRLAGGALLATVAVEMVLKNTSSGKGGANWLDNPFGGSNPSNPVKGSKPNALSSWDQLGADIANIWNSVWNNTIGRLNRGIGDSNKLLNGWWHDTAHWFDLARHDVSVIWDSVWNNTVGRTQRGVTDALHWIGTIPGKVVSFFQGAGSWLWNKGHDIVQGLWNGATTVWANVSGWFGRIWGWVTGVFNGSVTWLAGAGRNIITGLWNGLKGVWSSVSGWFGSIWGWVTGVFRGAGIWLFNSGFNIVNGLYQGILSLARGIGGWVNSNLVQPLINAVKSYFGIKSPSAVMAGIGGHLMSGLLGGMLAANPLKIAEKVFGGLPQALGSIVKKGLITIAGLPAKALNALKSLGGDILGFLGLGGGNSVPAASGSAAAAQRYAASLLSQYHWGQDQMGPLIALWNQESGWNANAVNPSSGAYGIPQSLGHGHPYNLGDYANQVVWGLNYIRATYGSPAAAWAHEVANNWYQRGSWDVPVTGGATVHKGEMILPAELAAAVRGALSGGSGGDAGLAAELRALRGQMAELIRTTAAVPAATGAHVGGAISGAAGAASFRSRYPVGGS